MTICGMLQIGRMRAPGDRLHPGHSRTAYRYPGVYFVTIITHLRKPLLGRRVGTAVSLSRLGAIVARGWEAIPMRFPHVRLDSYVIMPNHIHGILILHSPVPSPIRSHGAGPGLPNGSPGLEPGSLAAIVGSFKSTASREINRVRGTPGARVWQRNFHEHVLPDRESVRRVRRYITGNPSRLGATTSEVGKFPRGGTGALGDGNTTGCVIPPSLRGRMNGHGSMRHGGRGVTRAEWSQEGTRGCWPRSG